MERTVSARSLRRNALTDARAASTSFRNSASMALQWDRTEPVSQGERGADSKHGRRKRKTTREKT